MREKNKKNAIPEALITTKEKAIKEEPIQRMERRFNNRPKQNFQTGKQCKFCGAPKWNPTYTCPAREANCRNCEKNGHFAKVCRAPRRINRKVNEITEREEKTENESNETDTSIYHIKKINQIKEKRQSYTADVKINGKEKTFIIDTGSPVTIMPMDPEVINPKEIQQIKNKYQDVNKNEVKL